MDKLAKTPTGSLSKTRVAGGLSMYNVFCITFLLLLGSFLHAAGPSSLAKQPISVITEMPQSAFVNDTVNVINGSFYLQMHHMDVPGHVPLDLIQYYNNQSSYSSWLGVGMSLNYSFWMQGQEKDTRWSKLFAELPGGSIVSCLGKDSPDGTNYYYLDPEVIREGFTNCGSHHISARTNLKNARMKEKVKNNTYADWTCYLPDGTIRYYHRALQHDDAMNVHTELRPNKTRLHFSYYKYHEQEGFIRKITAAAKHTMNWLAFDAPPKQQTTSISSSNGKEVSFHVFKKGDEYYIDEIESTDNPKYTFHYTHAGDYYCIDRIERPDGRYLELEYDHKGRVKNQKAPVGHNGEKRTLYSFSYGSDNTEVVDAYDQKKVYNHKSGRITSIEHYADKKRYREQAFYWGATKGFSWAERPDTEEGDLQAYALLDKNQQGLFLCHYKYDKHGNIIKETHYGNFSGRGIRSFEISSDGHPKNDVESYHKQYRYSKNHLLTHEREDSGLTYEYRYKRNTDLVRAKFTSAGKKILRREFYKYDADGILIKKIVDDGSSHNRSHLADVTEQHITKIVPVRNKEGYGQGLPQEITEYYKKTLLKRTRYNYNKASQITEEAVFDASNTYRYSTYYEYDKKGRLIKKTNPLGQVFHYEYDRNNNKTYEKQEGAGFYTTYEYDTANRCIALFQHHKDGEKISLYFSYDLMGNKVSSTDRYGHTTYYEYDHANRLCKTIFPNKKTILREYDLFDNLSKETNQNGATTSYEYTIHHKPSRITYADGTHKRFRYNKDGTLAHEWDQSGTKTSYTYDVLRRVVTTSVYTPSGKRLYTTHNTYNSFHLLSSTDPSGHITRYRYDGAGRKIEEWKRSPNNYSKTTFAYGSLGRLSCTRNF
jgi:YD repeat-containing protein